MTLPNNTHKPGASPTLQNLSDSPSPSILQSSPRSSSQQQIAKKEIKVSEPPKDPVIVLEKTEVIEPLPNQDTLSRCSDSSQPADLNRSISHDSSKDRKESRGSDRSKKKSAFYNLLYPTYKSRSEDFKKNFKDVPGEERLIVDYSCAIQKDILVHGRLYVSQNYLCFYANIFRWETTVIIKWRDVTAITKEKTALVIPNAIVVCTESERHFFTSFGSRDKAYMMLFRIWQNALMEQPMSMQEMWQWVHSSYGEELGLTSEDDDYIPPSVTDEDKMCPTAGKLNLDCEDQFDLLSSPIKAETDGIPTDLSDTTESDVDRDNGMFLLDTYIRKQGTTAKCTHPHEGRTIVNAVLNIPIDQLFTLIFTNSKFFLEFHALRRTTDIKLSPWEQNVETGTKLRTLSMVVAVTHPLGPKSSSVIETQVMNSCSKPGHLYSIDSEIVNTGIPYADSFYISVHFCLTRISENETTIQAYANINYKKSVWGFVKNVIEKNTWAGLEDFYESYIKTLRSECEEITKGRKGRRRRRGVGGSNPVSILPQEELALSLKSPIFRTGAGIRDADKANNFLAYFVLLVLIVLVLLNIVLYYKLWSLEKWAHASRATISHIDLEILKHPPNTHEEWLKLLQHQENLHRSQLDQWQKIVQTAVQLLRKAEETLSELQTLIRSPPAEAVLSVLNTKRKEEL